MYFILGLAKKKERERAGQKVTQAWIEGFTR